MGTAFGGASQTVFGPRGAGSFIGKITGVVAGLFMLTSLVLAFLSSSRTSGLAEKVSALNETAHAAEEVDLATPESPGDTQPSEPAAAAQDAAPLQEAAPKAETEEPAEAQPEGEEEKPAADTPAAEKPVEAKPAADSPAAEKPAEEKPAADTPAAEKPAADAPAADTPAVP